MPRLIPSRLLAVCALAVSISVVASSSVATGAKGTAVQVRVVGSGNRVVGQTLLNAATASIKTSPRATCFGKGTGGSGRSVTIKGATALGALAQASKTTAALRPLLVTDHFVSEFGLGLCGIGKSSSTKKLSWYLKVNHKNPNKSGELVKLHSGDEVLWALEPYPYPSELVLDAPPTAEPSKPFTVTVFSYDDKGKKRAASGATVSGASGPTDQQGHATVTLAAPAVLSATHGKDIPSNQVAVCVSGACPKG